MNGSAGDIGAPREAVAETFGAWASLLAAADVPAAVRTVMQALIVDVIGLCIAARSSDYVAAILACCEEGGPCTAFGQARALNAAGAALANGTAAHGEDYDDTFEGTPVHAGAVIVPAVLAACEGFGRSGRDALRGMAAGAELTCRLALVAPTAMHRAGFHPTAVIGALGAAAGVSAALGLNRGQMASALGIAGSFASGIIEYLAEGTWTKRIHPGWAAQAGLHAARLAQAGFLGPRTVIEGAHGFFHAFADASVPRDYTQVTDGLGEDWRCETLAFKPYACGTMAQPFIDCAIALRERGVRAQDVNFMVCKVGEGTVHRLWEPRSEKDAPSTPYSAKFSVPYCIAVALIDGAAGLEQFSQERVADPEVLALARKVRYEVDPANEYPQNYTGHLRAFLAGGRSVSTSQPHLRGGWREPLTRHELIAKMEANLTFGGWPRERASEIADFSLTVFEQDDLAGLAAFRG
ncbi:MAG: MmgE/PrpD family protein [Hyphomicrobiales bacterium]|nr:MmgE/PrpD family protein [Hyphomicrobiales bacterium]